MIAVSKRETRRPTRFYLGGDLGTTLSRHEPGPRGTEIGHMMEIDYFTILAFRKTDVPEPL